MKAIDFPRFGMAGLFVPTDTAHRDLSTPSCLISWTRQTRAAAVDKIDQFPLRERLINVPNIASVLYYPIDSGKWSGFVWCSWCLKSASEDRSRTDVTVFGFGVLVFIKLL